MAIRLRNETVPPLRPSLYSQRTTTPMLGVIMIAIIYPTINRGWGHVPIVRLMAGSINRKSGKFLYFKVLPIWNQLYQLYLKFLLLLWLVSSNMTQGCNSQGRDMTYSAMCWYLCWSQIHTSHNNSSSKADPALLRSHENQKRYYSDKCGSCWRVGVL